MSNSVTIKVPARLHLGFLDLSGGIGRRFGSLGLPLNEPETVLKLEIADADEISGPESERAASHLEVLRAHLGITQEHRLTIEKAIPSHSGLGSGTQIALAVSAALRTLHELPLDIRGDASLLDRGGRSGIGIASFTKGGVIIDAGKIDTHTPPPVVARLPFPDEWRVLLILDRRESGLHGEDELEAFKSLDPFPESSAGDICRRVLMGVMPALIERDIASFGAAITDIQQIVGNHFAPAQGGVFTSKNVELIANKLAEAGAVGLGQSSWGPTGFAFARSEDEASNMVAHAQRYAEPGTEIRIIKGRNHGAIIET